MEEKIRKYEEEKVRQETQMRKEKEKEAKLLKQKKMRDHWEMRKWLHQYIAKNEYEYDWERRKQKMTEEKIEEEKKNEIWKTKSRQEQIEDLRIEQQGGGNSQETGKGRGKVIPVEKKKPCTR